MRRAREWLVTHLPWAGVIKRRLFGCLDWARTTRKTYAQHGEDSYLRKLLSDYDLSRAIYVDVGANHPTRISNTYLFYRLGNRGISIEPNRELAELHRIFRPGDQILEVGCGRTASLRVFEVCKAPVLSRFLEQDERERPPASQVWRRDYLPILPLDTIMSAFSPEWIFLLSIDVEGMDLDVLAGATATLSKSLLVCVEANGKREESEVVSLLESQNLRLLRILGCNLLFVNQDDRFEAYRRDGSNLTVGN